MTATLSPDDGDQATANPAPTTTPLDYTPTTTTVPPPVAVPFNPASGDINPHQAGAHTPGPPAVLVGDLVLYQLSAGDVGVINSNDPAARTRNAVLAGQEYPAVVVATFTPEVANLRVMLDGAGVGADYWATSRRRGDAAGQWHHRFA